MIDPPQITTTTERRTAAVHLTIPRAEIQTAMGPAIGEVMSVMKAKGIVPTGPLYSHHFRMSPETFDFEVGAPVSSPITPAGRVQPSKLPAARVARTIYRGPYEKLGAAWSEFMLWIEAEGLKTGDDLWECYLAGPESSPDPANWQTELNRPLV
jgi:effector-binding domain-containing protein